MLMSLVFVGLISAGFQMEDVIDDYSSVQV
jgi:hypothetical protein